MQTLVGLFEFGTLGFWLLLAFLSVVIISALNIQKFGWSAMISLAILAYYSVALLKQDWTWRNLGSLYLLYLLIGVFYSVFRWYWYVMAEAESYKNKTGEYAYEGSSQNEYRLSVLRNNVNVRFNKALITAWISYWLWDIMWELTGNVFVWAYESVNGLYQKISDKALTSVGALVGKK